MFRVFGGLFLEYSCLFELADHALKKTFEWALSKQLVLMSFKQIACLSCCRIQPQSFPRPYVATTVHWPNVSLYCFSVLIEHVRQWGGLSKFIINYSSQITPIQRALHYIYLILITSLFTLYNKHSANVWTRHPVQPHPLMNYHPALYALFVIVFPCVFIVIFVFYCYVLECSCN